MVYVKYIVITEWLWGVEPLWPLKHLATNEMNITRLRLNVYCRAALLTLLAALCHTTATAQDGSTAYNYLNITSSARIYGLGGVNITAVEDELGISDQNPALLGPEMDNQVLIDYMLYMGGSNFAGARYARGYQRPWNAWSV